MNYIALMAGGKGTRFWPKSRKALPKQFLNIGTSSTMLQETVERVRPFCKEEKIFIVTGKEYRNIILEQLPNLPVKNILEEPFGRNTAPCIALAAMRILEEDRDGVMVVLPSDHIIKNETAFLSLISRISDRALKEQTIITIGIAPDKPETGYGYIKAFKPKEEKPENPFLKVDSFREKPDLKTATAFLNEGNYYWNSGMFVFKAEVILGEIEKYLPQLYREIRRVKGHWNAPDFDTLLFEIYSGIDSISIDYGIMEKSRKVEMAVGNFLWNDVGSWASISETSEFCDENQNVSIAPLATIDSSGNIIDVTDSKKLIALIDINEMILVETKDVILVCPKSRAQDVKQIVESLEKKKREELL